MYQYGSEPLLFLFYWGLEQKAIALVTLHTDFSVPIKDYSSETKEWQNKKSEAQFFDLWKLVDLLGLT